MKLATAASSHETLERHAFGGTLVIGSSLRSLSLTLLQVDLCPFQLNPILEKGLV
jgi:hypothetical protein